MNYNENFRRLLKDFVCIFSKILKKDDNQSQPTEVRKKDNNKIIFSNEIFLIKNENRQIYNNINNVNDIDGVVEEILESFNHFNSEYEIYLLSIKNSINDKQLESFTIIQNDIKRNTNKAQRELDKFKVSIESDWGISKIRDELTFKLIKILRDMIEKIHFSILNGLKTNDNYYELVNMFNGFLSQLGVYTVNLKVGDTAKNFDLLEPQQTESNKTIEASKDGTLKEIINYPYLFTEDFIILEAKVVIWKYEG